MAVPRQITGVLKTPEGQAFPNRTLNWYRVPRKTRAQGGSVIADEPIATVLNGAGEVDVSVVPGLYQVQVRLKDADRYFEVAVPEGDGAFDIADGVDESAPPLTPQDVLAAQAARDAAEGFRDLARDWAQKEPGSPLETGGFSARHWAQQAELAVQETLSAYKGRQYASREAFVTDVAGDYDPTFGTIVSAGGVLYERKPGATALPGLPGWLPQGVWTLDHFGIVGDGVAIVTENIQRAIDERSAAGGGTLRGRAGVHILDDHDDDGYFLHMRTGVVLEGDGRDFVLKAANGLPAWTAGIRFDVDCERAALRTLTYDGNRYEQATTASQAGIVGGARTRGITLDGIDILNIASRAVITNEDGDLLATTDFAEEFNILNVRARNVGEKVFQVRNTRRAAVVGCHAHTDYRGTGTASAFESSNSEDVTFTACHSVHEDAAQGPGFRVVNNSKRVQMLGGVMRGGRQPVVVIDSQSVKAIGVTGIDNALGVLISSSDVDDLGRDITFDVLIDGLTLINPGADAVVANVVNNGLGVLSARVVNSWIKGGASTSYAVRNAGDLTASGKPCELREWGNTFLDFNASVPTLGAVWGAPRALRGDSLNSGRLDLAKDVVAIIPAPNGGNSGDLLVRVEGLSGWSAHLSYRCSGAANVTLLSTGATGRINAVSGALTGTTGDDTDLNIGADTAGNVYIENRNDPAPSSVRRIYFTFLNAS